MASHVGRLKRSGKSALIKGALATGALSMALAAVGTSSASASTQPHAKKASVVNLTFWSWVPGISASVDLWNKTHPNIHVTLDETTSGQAGTYAKMFSALNAGNAPDLGQVEYPIIPNFEHVGGLVDLSKYGANKYKSQFVPWTWKQVTLGNAVYAIPQDTGPMGLFYRADLFKKYHLVVPKTWAQYLTDAKKLHQESPTSYISAFPSTDSGWFSALAWQAGAKWFTTKGSTWHVNLNDPATIKVAKYWQNLVANKLVKVEPDFATGWYKDLSDGTLLTWPTAVWGENTLVTNAAPTKGDWRVAPMPSWGGKPSNGNWGGSTTVVFKDSKHPAQAAQFAEWLNTNQQSITSLITKGGLYPANIKGQSQKAANSPVAFYGNQNIYKVFKAGSKIVNTNFLWGPIMDTTLTEMSDGLSKASAGKGTLQAAINSTQSQTLNAMKSQGFSVTAG
ncbi:MAG: ABC transporter substrate-binding protein [Acidimicrobiales bacterium]